MRLFWRLPSSSFSPRSTFLEKSWCNRVSSASERSSAVASALCACSRHDQLGQFDLHRHGVAVLAVLDKEHHEKRDDGRSGVDDQLPGVAEMRNRTGRQPDEHDRNRDQERHGPPGHDGRRTRKALEPGDGGHPPLWLVFNLLDSHCRHAPLTVRRRNVSWANRSAREATRLVSDNARRAGMDAPAVAAR